MIDEAPSDAVQPHLILCNVNLSVGREPANGHANDLSGFETLVALRERVKHSAAIVMVAMNPEPAVMELCFMHDADTFSQLPLRPAQLNNLTVFINRRRRSAEEAAKHAASLRQSILHMETELKELLPLSPGVAPAAAAATSAPSSAASGESAASDSAGRGGLARHVTDRLRSRRGSAPAVIALQRNGGAAAASALSESQQPPQCPSRRLLRTDTAPLPRRPPSLQRQKTVTFQCPDAQTLDAVADMMMP